MMKKNIKKLLSNLINLGSKFCYKFFRKPKRVNSALVMVPSWEGSLGDEAVIDALSNQLKISGFEVTLIHFSAKREWGHLASIDKWESIDNYFKKGGWFHRIRFIFKFPTYSHFYLIGTDMLDGCYAEWLTLGMLTLTKQAAITGLKTTIVGFSLNNWQKDSCIASLTNFPKLTRLCLRDNVSLNRLEKLTGRSDLIQTADMAFLLNPNSHLPLALKFIDWIKERKAKNRLVIGININPQLFKKEESNKMEGLINSYVSAITRAYNFFNQQLDFVFIPHDFRPHNSDVFLLNKMFSLLPIEIRNNSYYRTERPSAAEIKAVVGRLDVILTGRMHVSIAGLGQGIPVGCVVYQGKFKGLFNHFHLNDSFKLSPEYAADANILSDFLINLIRNRKVMQETIRTYLPKVKSLAFRNLSFE